MLGLPRLTKNVIGFSSVSTKPIVIEAPIRLGTDGLFVEAAAEVVVADDSAAVGVAVTAWAKTIKAIAEMAEVNFILIVDIWIAWEVVLWCIEYVEVLKVFCD